MKRGWILALGGAVLLSAGFLVRGLPGLARRPVATTTPAALAGAAPVPVAPRLPATDASGARITVVPASDGPRRMAEWGLSTGDASEFAGWLAMLQSDSRMREDLLATAREWSRSADPGIRGKGLALLAHLQSMSSLEWRAMISAEADPSVRAFVVSLAPAGMTGSVVHFALQDPDPTVRRAAVHSFPAELPSETVAQAIRNERDPAVLASLVRHLIGTRARDEHAVEALKSVLADAPAPKPLRQLAAAGLARILRHHPETFTAEEQARIRKLADGLVD